MKKVKILNILNKKFHQYILDSFGTYNFIFVGSPDGERAENTSYIVNLDFIRESYGKKS